MNTETADIDIDNEPGPEPSEIFTYDFGHPQHRLGEPNSSLNVSGGKLASQLSVSVDTVLHVASEISLVSVEFQKQNDLIQALDKNACIFKSLLDPQSVESLILLDRDLILALVASYFGGSAEPAQPSAVREFSASERRLAERLKTCITDVMKTIWGNAFTVIASNSPMLNLDEFVISDTEQSVVAAFKYSVKCNESESFFTIALPWAAVKAIQLNNAGNEIEKRVWCTRLQDHLENCYVDLQGQLTETELTVEQLMNIQVGDFIPLGDPGATTFKIDNTPVFDAEIGASNGLVSASILRWLSQGER